MENAATTPKHILVTQPLHDEVAQRLRALGTLDMHRGPEPLAPDELARRLVPAHALMGFMTDGMDASILRHASHLRIVACALKGPDSYDIAACTAARVWLSIVPDLLTEPTAELAVGLLIGLARRLREGDAWVRGGQHRGWRPRLYGRGLNGSTVAVLGMGRVGQAIVQRLRGFGCALLGYDVQAVMPAGVQGVSLTDALARADSLVLALPLTPQTLHRIGEVELALSKPGALWVNVGRGSVVDEAAMARHLATGQVGGYAADVFAFEDWGLTDRPGEVAEALRAHPRTLFTPHLGSAVGSVRLAIEHRAVDNIEAALRGQVPPDALNSIGAPTGATASPPL